MRTARGGVSAPGGCLLLGVGVGGCLLQRGGVCSEGVCSQGVSAHGVVSAPGGVCSQGGVYPSMH